MTLPTFIPGFLGTVMLNAEDVSAMISGATLSLTRNALNKPTLGQPWGYAIAGQRGGTISYDGHLSAEQASDLQSIYMADVPVDFSFQMGEGGGDTDAGLYTGKAIVTELSHTVAADGEWDWSLSCQTTGPVIYTPATPGP
jgi:predicted secreted protein